ncbi:MAG: CDP-alcohol phosphatidyltransferase family protein, partial [Deltaproteobacteria bacterium]|nr:CDP-alcohol phosphatidyltransferase family protein [Deltaproteobacteria bacterium]
MKKKSRINRDNMKKGIYILPNLFTTASLFFGFYSIIASIGGDFSKAAVAIIISCILDGLDGKIARVTNT